MRKLSCIFFFSLFVSFSLRAQDTIYRINGEMMIVEMMQISGDSIQFRQDGIVMKISNAGLSKINYSGGNTTLFSTPVLKSKAAKAILLPGFPDAPIQDVMLAYYINGVEIKSKEVDEMFRIQNDWNIHRKYIKLENTNAYRTLFFAAFALGAAIPIGYLFLDTSSRARNNVKSKVNYNSRYIFGGVWVVSGVVSLSLHNASINKKKELVKLYNSTFYPSY